MQSQFDTIIPGGHPVPSAQLPELAAFTFFQQAIPAGFPSPATDYEQATLDLNEYLVQHKTATFFFRVAGRSMIGAHIDDGDIVAIDRSIEAKHGRIVLAVVDNEYTIKRLYSSGGVLELRPENPAFRPIRGGAGCSEIAIWGVATGLVRRFGDAKL